MNIIVNGKTSKLLPFSINHASFEMKVGIFTNLERIISLCDGNDKIYLEVDSDVEE